MKRFVLRRLGYAALSMVLLSVTIFLFVRVTGDPTVLLVEPGASRADIDALRHDLGLDRSLLVQYGTFVKDIVRGDFGRSFYYRTPVLELYLSRLPNSLLLALAAMAFSLIIGIPTGIYAVQISQVGYNRIQYQNVKVASLSTTRVDAGLGPATVALMSLGIASPKLVEWRCAPPNAQEGHFPTPRSGPTPVDTTGR